LPTGRDETGLLAARVRPAGDADWLAVHAEKTPLAALGRGPCGNIFQKTRVRCHRFSDLGTVKHSTTCHHITTARQPERLQIGAFSVAPAEADRPQRPRHGLGVQLQQAQIAVVVYNADGGGNVFILPVPPQADNRGIGDIKRRGKDLPFADGTAVAVSFDQVRRTPRLKQVIPVGRDLQVHQRRLHALSNVDIITVPRDRGLGLHAARRSQQCHRRHRYPSHNRPFHNCSSTLLAAGTLYFSSMRRWL